MSHVAPATAQELAEVLRSHSSQHQAITVAGNNSKLLAGGPVMETACKVSTAKLSQVLDYEPNDLTISVGAGLRFAELQARLAQHGQMIALDPPFSDNATVGGVIATNGSGSLRCAYGTARDLVIGMEFATLAGKLIRTGGMVVKNVAGLDMAKIMIGSLGTLAVITSVNFRLHSLPAATNTFFYQFPKLENAIEKRNQILESVLQPMTLDLLSPEVSSRFSRRGYVLAIRAAGADRVLARYRQELNNAELLRGTEEVAFWKQMQELPTAFLNQEAEGIIIRVSTPLQNIGKLPHNDRSAFVSRAANGITYFYFPNWPEAFPWWQQVAKQGLPAVVEYAPLPIREREKLWSASGSAAEHHAFAMMERVKQMFDQDKLLNAKRLYGRI